MFRSFSLVDFAEWPGMSINIISFLLFNQTPNGFRSKFVHQANQARVNDSDYKGFAYDAAWLVALALNRSTQKLGTNVFLDTIPFGDKNVSDLIKESLLSTEFLGVTVSVGF